MKPRSISDGGDPQALIEVAARHRQERGEKAAPPESQPPATAAARRGRKAAPAALEAPAAVVERKKRPPQKRVNISTDTVDSHAALEKTAPVARKPRGAQAPGWLARLGAWGIAAAAAGLAVLVLTLDGLHEVPQPMPVTSVRIAFLPGPQLPVAEVLRWVNRFPDHEGLHQPNTWVLDQLAQFLRTLPAVAQVSQIRLVHQPSTDGKKLHRTLQIDLGLRVPVMPTVLTSGERAWVDQEGRILPGILPGPAQHRPLLRGVEQVKPEVVLAALAMWAHLEPQLEPELVTDIVLNETLDERGATGIVLYTRYHNRLIWGDPHEERFGVTAANKVRDLVRTIHCQGDMGRIAVINVRFAQPFYSFRE
jgi:hypothetical protein